MRWRKVLSPLGLPGLAVICTRANRRLVRGAALSLQTSVLRFLQRLPFLLISFFTLHHLSPSSLSIWLHLASSLRCLYSAFLDCSFLFVCLQESFLLAAKLNALTVEEVRFFSQKGSSTFSWALKCSSNVIRTRFSFSLINNWMWSLDTLHFHSTHQFALFGTVSSTAWETVKDGSRRIAQGNGCALPWWRRRTIAKPTS